MKKLNKLKWKQIILKYLIGKLYKVNIIFYYKFFVLHYATNYDFILCRDTVPRHEFIEIVDIISEFPIMIKCGCEK